MAAWVREKRKTPPKTGRCRKRQKEVDLQVKVKPGGDHRKLETFQGRGHWTAPRTPEVASTAPIGKPANVILYPENIVLYMLRFWVQMRGTVVALGGGGIGWLAAAIYLSLPSEGHSSCCARFICNCNVEHKNVMIL